VKEPPRSREAADYFRINPHRLQLGNIGLEIVKRDGSPASIDDIRNIDQQLDMWSGTISSRFTVEDIPVTVITVCHQQQDVVAFSVQSRLITEKRLRIRVRFPYPTGAFKDVGNYWRNDKQTTSLRLTATGGVIKRVLDTAVYYAHLRCPAGTAITRKAADCWLLTPGASVSQFSFSCLFAEKSTAIVPAFTATLSNSRQQWQKF